MQELHLHGEVFESVTRIATYLHIRFVFYLRLGSYHNALCRCVFMLKCDNKQKGQTPGYSGCTRTFLFVLGIENVKICRAGQPVLLLESNASV